MARRQKPVRGIIVEIECQSAPLLYASAQGACKYQAYSILHVRGFWLKTSNVDSDRSAAAQERSRSRA